LTLLLNQLDPIQCDVSSLEKSIEERAAKIITDATKLEVPNLFLSSDILTGNELLNKLFCAELFSRNNGLESQQKFNEEEKRNFARIINIKLKNDQDVADLLPINPENDSLFEVMKDGLILK